MIRAAAQPDALLGWMESLADPTRLRLLRLLERRELGVADLCDALQLPQSTISRHLKVLAGGGWLTHRRRGTGGFYALDAAALDPPARRLWAVAREQTEGWATLRQDGLRLARRLEDRRSDAEAFFAGAAAEWDQLRGELYGAAWNGSALLALLPREWTVADLGCGTANLTAELAKHVGRVVGVDQSAAMLKAARKRTEGLANVELRRGEIEALPLDDASCDAAVLALVLTYTADPPAVLREMARVVRPGGRAVVVDLLRHDREDFRRRMGQAWPGFEPAEVAAWLTAAGWHAPRVVPLPPEPEAKGPALFLAAAELPPQNPRDSSDVSQGPA